MYIHIHVHCTQSIMHTCTHCTVNIPFMLSIFNRHCALIGGIVLYKLIIKAKLYCTNNVVIPQVVEKELLIQEKEKLYTELKQILQRQPGPEVAEQLQIYQQTLKDKTKHMKVCTLHFNRQSSTHNYNVQYYTIRVWQVS